MRLWIDRRASPVGGLLILLDEAGQLRALDFDDHEARMHRLLRLHYDEVSIAGDVSACGVADAMAAYFEGDFTRMEALAVTTGGTLFQRSVWQALPRIGAGCTKGYGELATELGRPSACRAVGLANGDNPVAIVLPCHRVIGKSGALTGYGGGLWRKRWLLDHEARHGLPASLDRLI